MLGGRSALSCTAAAGPGGDESEALQADVMRFVAILGLCLMVIFALVQSLPAANESREAERAEVLAELVRLEERLAGIDERGVADLEAVIASLEEERAARTRLEAEAARSESTLVARLDRLESELAASESARAASERGRREAERAVRTRDAELAGMRETLERATTPLAGEPPESVPTVPPELSPSPETASDESLPVDPAPVETDAPGPSPEEGFSLRFTSDAALYALVARGAIDVHARIGHETWRLARDGLRVVRAAAPRTFNVMAESTIPVELPERLREAGASGGPATWSVTLSEAMSRAIAVRMEGATGGILLIGEDGDVDLR